MKGLWLDSDGVRLRDDLPRPAPPDGEALIRVIRAGICNTDIELIRGYYPYDGILGHEFVGVVEDGPPPLLGRRVCGEINAVCGECRACRSGRRTHCEDRTVLGIVQRDGAFAEYLTLPAENLHPVPDTVSTDAATFTEPLAAALEIREQIRVRPEDRVLVVGDGKLGQLIARSLLPTGCALHAVGRHERKLDLLRKRGAVVVADDAVEERVYNIAIECTGNEAGFETARRALRPRGTLVMKSTYTGRLTIDAAAVVVDELTLLGSRCGPFAPALRMLASGQVDVEDLVDARYPLVEAEAAIEHATRPGVLKVLLDME